MNIPVYNCLIDENTEDQSGIYAISFVDVPANEIDFVTLSKQPQEEKLNRDFNNQLQGEFKNRTFSVSTGYRF